MRKTRDDEVSIIVKDLLPSFAFLWRTARDVMGEVSWGNRGLDRPGLKFVVVIADAVYSIIACFPKS